MREVIVGGDGFIGKGLSRMLPDAIKTTRRAAYLVGDWPYDLREGGKLPAADIIYICAGINGTLTCARDPQGSWRTNVDGTIRLAEKAAGTSHVIWISSTTVEWCNEAYAVQKRTAETVLRTMPHVGIIRAGRVTSDNLQSLCETMIDMGRSLQSGLILWGKDERPYDTGARITNVIELPLAGSCR